MKTKSEQIFEDFLTSHSVPFGKILEDTTSRPDYLVSIGKTKLIFELKDLTEDKSSVLSMPRRNLTSRASRGPSASTCATG